MHMEFVRDLMRIKESLLGVNQIGVFAGRPGHCDIRGLRNAIDTSLHKSALVNESNYEGQVISLLKNQHYQVTTHLVKG